MNLFRAWLLIALIVSAGKPTAQGVAHAVEARYSRAHTLQARFYERYRASGQPGQSESGIVYFSKPGRMRWEYESPQTKLFLVDGTNVWLYTPADRTVSRAKLNESDDWRTPLALLTGKVHLDRLCGSIEFAAAAQAGDQPLDPRDWVLNCLPRRGKADETSTFSQILFEIDPSYHLGRVLIREAGETETEFRFGDWRENVDVPEAKFHFEVPKGVSVVDAGDLGKGIQ